MRRSLCISIGLLHRLKQAKVPWVRQINRELILREGNGALERVAYGSAKHLARLRDGYVSG